MNSLRPYLAKKTTIAFLIVYIILFLLYLVYPQNLKLVGEGWGIFFSFNAYGIVGIIGGIYGLYVAKKCGGWGSKLGRGLVFLACGLIAQNIGLYVFSYFNLFLDIEIPYPSLADLFYVSLIPFNALSLLYLGHLAGAKFSLKTPTGKAIAFSISFFMIILSYVLFLKDINLDFSNPLKLFFDIAYPLGEALNFALALTVYVLTLKTLGGNIKLPMLSVIVYCFLIFIADYTFLFTANNGTYYDGSWIDFIYVTEVIAGCIAFTFFDTFTSAQT